MMAREQKGISRLSLEAVLIDAVIISGLEYFTFSKTFYKKIENKNVNLTK